ncbi:hypothetical protein PVK06_012921 [Gossypium arboreum]|uniref:Uncharacterized protein n=1 Tax=Gossypium arboreum TaxID=29729 RepID=A0ABR0QDI7_GOSAR|nr:hypothetical protein PVK06_012921 [Gossypium arboreum]
MIENHAGEGSLHIRHELGKPFSNSHHAPEPEPELHSGDSSYHPDLGGNDYFPGSSAHGYYSEFGIFSPLPHQHSSHPDSYPPQCSAPSGPYPPPYSTPPGPYQSQYSTPPSSSSSMALETYDFSFMFRTPPHTDEENVNRHNRPQRERRAPQKYTPRTTPSNH